MRALLKIKTKHDHQIQLILSFFVFQRESYNLKLKRYDEVIGNYQVFFLFFE